MTLDEKQQLERLFDEIANAIRTKRTDLPDGSQFYPGEFSTKILEIITGGGQTIDYFPIIKQYGIEKKLLGAEYFDNVPYNIIKDYDDNLD